MPIGMPMPGGGMPAPPPGPVPGGGAPGGAPPGDFGPESMMMLAQLSEHLSSGPSSEFDAPISQAITVIAGLLPQVQMRHPDVAKDLGRVYTTLISARDKLKKSSETGQAGGPGGLPKWAGGTPSTPGPSRGPGTMPMF